MERYIRYNASAGSKTEAETANEGILLRNLTLSEGSISFDPDVTEYSIEVSEDTQKILVNAEVMTDTSFYTVSGNDNLKDGYNYVTVTVTDSSGNIGVYTIRVQRGEVESTEESSSEVITTAAGTTTAGTAAAFDLADTASSLVKTVTTGRYRYVTYSVAGCGALAIILWIAYLISRSAAARKRKAAQQERIKRREARQKDYELAEKQQDELLKQVDSILAKKKNSSRKSNSPQWLEDSEQQEYTDIDYDDDDEDSDIDEELEKWLNSLPKVELGGDKADTKDDSEE